MIRFAPFVLIPSLLSAIPEVAQAQEAQLRIEFNIASQPLEKALNEFAAQADARIVFYPKTVEGRVAPRLVGAYSPRAALEKLLADSELVYHFRDERTIIIDAAGKPTADAAAGNPLRLAQAEGQAAEGGAAQQAADSEEAVPEVPEVPEVTVVGHVDFVQNDAYGATKMGMPIKDTPFTVIAVTHDLMDMASISAAGDLYKLDPSGSPSHQDAGNGSSRIRGFDGIRRIDGFREAQQWNVELDLVSFDRIEIIKGGVSTLYGQNEPGGVVNYVSKLPEHDFAVRMRGEAGSHEYYRYEGDVTGPIGAGEGWSYRVLGAIQNDDTFKQFGRDDRVVVVPSLMYRNDRSSVVLRAHYERLKQSGSFGPALQLDAALPTQYAGDWAAAVADGAVGLKLIPGDVPRSRTAYNAPGLGWDRDILLLQAQLEHRFESGWTLRANVQDMDLSTEGTTISVYGPYDVTGQAMGDMQFAQSQQFDGYSGEINLFGHVELLGREHLLFFGADYARQKRYAAFGYGSYFGYDVSRFNILNPVPITLDPESALYNDPVNYRNTYSGITVQAVLNPVDRLKVMLGGRYNSDRGGSANGPAAASIAEALQIAKSLEGYPQQSTHHFTRQFGAVYELTPRTNAYLAYSESFAPTSSVGYSSTDPAGTYLDPPQGTTYEAGVKGSFPNAWSYGVAAFEITQDIVITDPLHPAFEKLVGGRRNRGIELTLQGKLWPAVNVFAGASYQNSEYVAGPSDGFRSATAPRLGLTLYGTYEVLGGPWQGFGVGAGVVHKGDRKGSDVSYNFRDPGTGRPYLFDYGSYTEVDARLFFNRDRWGVYAAATNLLDERYYEIGAGDLLWVGQHVNPGRMLRVGFSLKL